MRKISKIWVSPALWSPISQKILKYKKKLDPPATVAWLNKYIYVYSTRNTYVILASRGKKLQTYYVTVVPIVNQPGFELTTDFALKFVQFQH